MLQSGVGNGKTAVSRRGDFRIPFQQTRASLRMRASRAVLTLRPRSAQKATVVYKRRHESSAPKNGAPSATSIALKPPDQCTHLAISSARGLLYIDITKSGLVDGTQLNIFRLQKRAPDLAYMQGAESCNMLLGRSTRQLSNRRCAW
jgi:hypothetical protein